MSDATFRIRRQRPFTQIDNEMISDKRLSIQALGLGVRMLRLNPDYEYSAKHIQSIAGVSRGKLKSLFDELIAAGYLKKEQTHGEHGKFGRNCYEIVDISWIPPLTENPSTVEPSTVKQSTVSISKNNNISPYSPPEGDKRADFFDRFWALYPRKQGKKKARQAWDKLAPDKALCSKMSVALKAQIRSEEWTRDGGRYIPYPATWLNGRRWEDEVHIQAPHGAPPAPVREEDEFL